MLSFCQLFSSVNQNDRLQNCCFWRRLRLEIQLEMPNLACGIFPKHMCGDMFQINWYQSFTAYLSLGLGLPLLIDLLVMYVHSSFLSLQHFSKNNQIKNYRGGFSLVLRQSERRGP